jgi:hypothetical protein
MKKMTNPVAMATVAVRLTAPRGGRRPARRPRPSVGTIGKADAKADQVEGNEPGISTDAELPRAFRQVGSSLWMRVFPKGA